MARARSFGSGGALALRRGTVLADVAHAAGCRGRLPEVLGHLQVAAAFHVGKGDHAAGAVVGLVLVAPQ